MPLTHFECPDGELVKLQDCLDKCRMECRCVSKPTLVLMSRQRTWKGKISTTQGFNGTRYEFLRITRDYSERPCDRAFALLGTFHHLKLQGACPAEGIAEEFLEDAEGTGIADYYDSDECALWDFKTMGAWRVAKVTGRSKIEEEIPEGQPGHGLFASGPRKGTPRTRSSWGMVEPDDWELRMQLSRYAMMYEAAGFPVKGLYVQVTVRDFGARTPVQYGIHRQIYVLKINRIPAAEVQKYYNERQAALVKAVDTGQMPPACNVRETWDGIRCARFCPVWRDCDKGWKAHETPQKKEEEGNPNE